MSHFLDRIRSGAGRAAFEADKMRRIASIQSTIKSVKEEINEAFYRAGQVAYESYREGQVTQPKLLGACERIGSLQAQIMAREQEIEVIRNEAFSEPEHQSQYGYLCPNGHGELPSGAKFCPVCGSQAVHVPPPPPDETGSTCPTCGAEVGSVARFCPACGSATSQPSLAPSAEEPPQEEAETPPPPPAQVDPLCARCGSSLVPGAIFCPDCGYRVEEEVSTSGD